ncbi:retrotransposon protein, putative, ty1-copia subclass [Tanacetum coccineum]
MDVERGKFQKANKKLLKAKGKGKVNGKGKDKQVYIPKPKTPKPSTKEHPAKDNACHHCKECFTDYGISISKNDILYFNAIPRDGIYEIDMHNLVPNVNYIYNVSNERAKNNFDSTYLWHYRLAHINKKCIEKLQQERILKSTDDESFDQCVSCLSGKMTRKPFPHRTERVTDLLGIIHTDVCGTLRHVSRQGASYFITFTDDYSHYGYVYLLKHKHEVFETFKVFKNGVENQIRKIIKALRSDREFETRILNMVPTKKVDKTPYELWYGKVPNLSYLKEMMGYYFYFPPENKIVVARVEGFEPPQEEVIMIRRSEKTHQAPNRLCLNVEAGEHKMQSMIDNKVSVLVDIPPNCKTVGKTFSPVANIRAIRILISIAAFYDYEIWQMDVKTAFLNGYLDDDIYMVQPEGASTPEEVKRMQNVPYASAVGSSMYAVRCTRPDVSFAQNLTSRFQQNPSEPHWTAVKNTLKYLKNTKDMFLVYGGNPEAELRVDCYCDAVFETDRDDTKSQTGYVFILNGGAVD